VDIYYNIEHYNEALEYAKKAMTLENKDESYLKNKIAKIYAYTGRAKEAIDMIKGNDLSNIEMLEISAMAHCKENDFNNALKICEDAVEKAAPYDVAKIQNIISKVYCEHAVYCFDHDEYADAFDKFTEALKYDSDNSDVYFKLCNVNRKIKDHSEAIKQCKRAIELSPETSKYYIGMGDIYVDLQNHNEAKKQYNEAISIDPKNTFAYTKLGVLQARDGEYKDAIKSLKKAMSVDNNNPDVLYNLALVYELSGNIDRAKQAYREVLEIDPNHQETINNLQILGG
jgi:Flp pilus assembly protein TadD